jgi:hypothetical protein
MKRSANSVQPSKPLVVAEPALLAFPPQVCVLDIETEDTDFSDKSNCKVAVVGVKVYTLTADGKGYAPGEYRAYLSEQFSDLATFLKAFPGPVIGHNLLDFDFPVLRPHVALEGVVERAVDTLYFLYSKNGKRLGGLKLDALCKENFGIGKTVTGASIPAMWKEGKRDEVIRYNENDCDLNLRLWWHMASGGAVKLPPLKDGRQKTLTIEAADLPRLFGQSPAVKYPEWVRRAVKNDRLITFPMKAIEFEDFGDFFDDGLMFPREYEHATFYCAACDATSLFEGTVVRGNASHEKVRCPKCGKELGTMREDEASEPTCLGTLPGNLGNTVSQGMMLTAFEDILRKHVQAERGSWLHDEEPVGDQCHICGKTPGEGHFSPDPEPFYENPVDGTPICLTCMTACRWVLSIR